MPGDRPRARDLLRLVRLPNTFSAMGDVLAGAVLAGMVAPDLPLLLAILGSACIYGGGVALGDVLDLEKDRRLHPNRPLPRGAVSKRAAWIVSLLLLAAGVATASITNPLHLAATLALVLSVVLYDACSDRIPAAGPILMGTCRGLNMLRGITLGADVTADCWFILAAYATLVLAITAISTFEERPGSRCLRPLTGLVIMAWLVPSVLSPGVLGKCLAIPVAFFVAMWVVSPVWRRPSRPGMTVYRGVFTLVLYQALVACISGHLVAAALLTGLLPVMRLTARLIGQEGS